MKLLPSLPLLLAASHVASAHTLLTTLFVDDVNQGDGTCIRMPKNPSNATSPVVDMKSWDMACGFDGNNGVARVCPVPQAGKLSFLFRAWPDATQPGTIDISHKGPCAVYMKQMGLITSLGGHGPGWFKIYDEGYDMKTKKWCTEKLIDNNGFLSIRIPKDLLGGDYLVRTEILALHEADKNPPEPQWYISCAQISLDSPAGAVPVDTVEIPGHIASNHPSVLFNIYNNPKFPYAVPGPKIYQSGISKATQIKQDPSKLPKLGRLPKGAVLTNANWWTTEVPSYNDEAGCWRSSKQCYQRLDECYKTAPPTGSKNCGIWEKRCMEINDDCNGENLSGPPNAGKDLNPPKPLYGKIPPPANAAAFSPEDVSGPLSAQTSVNALSTGPVVTSVKTSSVPGSTFKTTTTLITQASYTPGSDTPANISAIPTITVTIQTTANPHTSTTTVVIATPAISSSGIRQAKHPMNTFTSVTTVVKAAMPELKTGKTTTTLTRSEMGEGTNCA